MTQSLTSILSTRDDEQVEHSRSLEQFLFDFILLFLLSIEHECHQNLEPVVDLINLNLTRYIKKSETPVASTVERTELRDLSAVGTK